MYKYSGFTKLAVVAGLLSLTAISSFSAGVSDEEKLKDLERAMSAPSSAAPAKKSRTRAIVFDAEPAQNAAPGQKSEASKDCKSLPANVSATAVDFAIQFKAGSSDLAPSSEKLLIQIAKILALSPDKCVLVEGHTDVSGNADMNMALSSDRASSVVKFVVEKADMESKRFVPIGKGSTDLVKNLDPRNPLHRRVVFKVVG
jgi:outer membrane protein OmpA-like peptidoglycan-associated protein